MVNKENLYSQSHLFWINSKDEIKHWIKNLNFFIFNRAFGGHANDPDEFITAIRYDSVDDLRHISKLLQINLDDLNEEALRNIELKIFSNYEKIGHQNIIGFNWFIYLSDNHMMIKPRNCEPYCVCEIDFNACKKFEDLIIENKLSNRIPLGLLKNDNRAITLDRYKEYFE
jgi:hypothetical protein